jgi:hypothetical protein
MRTDRDLPSYDDLLASATFQADLASLNTALRDALEAAGAAPVLNGNLFYPHLAPQFWKRPPEPEAEAKRRALVEIARRGRTLLEIGVNGGHSLLLAKSANPALSVIGLDVAAQLDPAWARVDLYVPVTMDWLARRFPGDIRFRIGDSRVEAPRFAVENPETRLDILHVDGAKETYFRDVVNLLPLLHEESLVVIDDTDLREVRLAVRRLVEAGLAELHPDFPPERLQRYQHVVLRPLPDPAPARGARQLARKLRWHLGLERRLPYGWR